MKKTYKHMRSELIEYVKAYNALDVILMLSNDELETLYLQVYGGWSKGEAKRGEPQCHITRGTI
jgi:hypothetical protein